MFTVGSIYEVTIDRESNAGNWIATIADNVHVTSSPNGSKQLDEDQVWKARYIGKTDGIHEFRGVAFIGTVDDEDGEDTATVRELAEMVDADRELNQEAASRRRVRTDSEASPTGSLNSLLTGKKI